MVGLFNLEMPPKSLLPSPLGVFILVTDKQRFKQWPVALSPYLFSTHMANTLSLFYSQSRSYIDLAMYSFGML